MIKIVLDQDGDGKKFDAALRRQGTLPDDGRVEVVTKSDGTLNGQAIVLITFGVECPDGAIRRAQTVLTAREFLAAADAVRGCHPPAAGPAPRASGIEGVHRGVGYSAMLVERVYLIRVEGSDSLSLAFHDAEARKVAEAAVNLMLDGG